MDELKPCPFCGGGAIKVYAWENSTDIICLDCKYTIKYYDCDEEDAVVYWNTRPAEDALTAEIKRLKADNERLKKALKKIDDLTFMPRNKDKVLDKTWHITRAALCTDTDAPDMNVATKESEGEDE